MGNTAALVAATPCRLVYLLTGDGTVVGPTIASATMITDLPAGPLEDNLSASYASQAVMRINMFGTPCSVVAQLRATGNDVTAEHNQIVVDTDVDAVTATRPELNVEMSDTTGQIAYLIITFHHSLIR